MSIAVWWTRWYIVQPVSRHEYASAAAEVRIERTVDFGFVPAMPDASEQGKHVSKR